MRLSRRAALAFAGAAALAPVGLHFARARGPGESDGPRPSLLHARPILALLPREAERRRFGALTFRAGLELWSDDPDFGGWSGLWRSPDGRRLVAVSDRAHWLTAIPHYEEGRLAGLDEAVVAPILGSDGRPLRGGRAFDVEALAIADGAAFVAIERVHEVRRFDWDRDGIRARGIPVPLPSEADRLPFNEGLEALGVAPPRHPLAGCLVAIAERAAAGDEAPTRGWVVTGPNRFAFTVRRSLGFDVTDIVFLPSGEALLLERRFSILSGVACRIRRLARDAFRPDGELDGEVVFEADRGYEIDNMEGITAHRDPATGETVVTLISDDNFSFLQRTVLLEFSLAP
ncbi:esterase-like activity of phytase family protein [Enterovirga aerilata]|uniref:Twin-arginine translocation pathway signal n=1 Tax=Enterovirga aerilata TaxID=2730920 RepID=A0A849I460_9HYPH|nr:esterase-like activity of phytase family protein [Enterovirga sp. DB1703]NNM74616.1 twin-arginine translocation pathway signal [Enterovirga sp. DB1703]